MKMMNLKWLTGLFLIGILAVSCLDDEPVANVIYKYRPVDSIQIDTILPARQVTEIKTFFTTANSCQTFFDYEYNGMGNERTVAVIVSEFQDGNCEEISEINSYTLNFRPETSGVYIFRFWKGKGENGQDLFFTREIEIP